MWLAKHSVTQEGEAVPQAAKVICATSGEKFLVGESEYRNIPGCTPYGVYSRPIPQKEVLVLSTPRGEVYLGTIEESLLETLMPGEILLRSAGGASIKLCNDGKVLINGKEVV